PAAMPPDAAISLPLVQSFHPATFLERGVALPFTTPALGNTRGRPGARGAFDMIVPNPSGGRGVYIIGWDGVRQLCRPTLHDVRLAAQLAALPAVTPSAIRRVERDILAEGLAGREAQQAAAKAAAIERQDRLVTNFQLLLALVRQVDPESETESAASGAAIEARARRSLARIAPRLGRGTEEIAASLEALADLFAPIGLPGQAPPARIPRLLAELRGLAVDTAQWSRRRGGEDGGQAGLVAAGAELTITCAGHALEGGQGLTRDMLALLREHVADPLDLAARLARPEWLLDGWEPIALLWRCAGTDADRVAALAEMAALVPVLPRETASWLGMDIDTEALTRVRRAVRLNEDWRTGHMFERIARNEHLRALAA
ncbi:MAG: hypothetical protein KGI51_06915, partial [Rhodospirillales bacterium]|nr:hypothetical protein [Rhodospirillales bacterium]